MSSSETPFHQRQPTPLRTPTPLPTRHTTPRRHWEPPRAWYEKAYQATWTPYGRLGPRGKELATIYQRRIRSEYAFVQMEDAFEARSAENEQKREDEMRNEYEYWAVKREREMGYYTSYDKDVIRYMWPDPDAIKYWPYAERLTEPPDHLRPKLFFNLIRLEKAPTKLAPTDHISEFLRERLGNKYQPLEPVADDFDWADFETRYEEVVSWPVSPKNTRPTPAPTPWERILTWILGPID